VTDERQRADAARLGFELVFAEDDPSPRPTGSEAELEGMLEVVRAAAFRHPIAVQAAFSALIAEGRRFAETPEGAGLLEELLHSPTVSRLRVAWEVLTMSAFVESAEGAIPSVFVETFLQKLRVTALEPLLARLLERRA
jgi:hypothetical protein